MAEVIMAIALLCQTTASGSYSMTYEQVGAKRKECHRTLLTCVNKSKQLHLDEKLANCIQKGEY